MSEIQSEPAGTAGQGEPEPKAGKTYSEDEFNAHTARLRKAEEAKRTKLEGELARLQEAQKTEAEKAMDRVRQETAAEWAGKLQAQKVDAELKVKLLERGLPANAAHLVKATNEIGSVEEIDAAIDATLRANDWLKPGKAAPAHSGQGGAPGKVELPSEWGPPWTKEKVQQLRQAAQKNPAIWTKYADQIAAAVSR